MFKTAVQHLKRTPYRSLVVILNMSLAFFILAVFIIIALGAETTLKFLESRPQLTAFLRDDAKPQQVELLKSKLESTGNVSNVKFISKDEALVIYKNEIKDNPLLLEMVTAKILPASFEISARSLNSLPVIAEIVKAEPIVEDVLFQEDVVSTLSSLINGLRIMGLFLILFLTLVSLLNVVIVIGMKVSQHRSEMEILNLMGATGWYIRGPFILQGIIYGLISGFIAWLASWLLLLYATPFLIQFLAGIPLFPIPTLFIVEILSGLLVFGIIIGWLGSILSLGRFSKAGR